MKTLDNVSLSRHLLWQIYLYDILLFDALLCHIWQGHGVRPEHAGSVADLLTVIVFCMTV